jgi:hypothetical protein
MSGQEEAPHDADAPGELAQEPPRAPSQLGHGTMRATFSGRRTPGFRDPSQRKADDPASSADRPRPAAAEATPARVPESQGRHGVEATDAQPRSLDRVTDSIPRVPAEPHLAMAVFDSITHESPWRAPGQPAREVQRTQLDAAQQEAAEEPQSPAAPAASSPKPLPAPSQSQGAATVVLPEADAPSPGGRPSTPAQAEVQAPPPVDESQPVVLPRSSRLKRRHIESDDPAPAEPAGDAAQAPAPAPAAAATPVSPAAACSRRDLTTRI